MTRLILFLSFLGVPGSGQALREYLLRVTEHIEGIVVDSAGHPIAGALIDYTNDPQNAFHTDANGNFQFDTNVPSVVVRKPGYRSERVKTQNAEEVRITLYVVSPPRTLPACASTGQWEGLDGGLASFRFPMIGNVEASAQRHDIDDGIRNYFIRDKRPRQGISHGSGPLWGSGMPVDVDVWRSVRYDETVFEVDGMTVVDARGQFPNGERWRNLGKFGESAWYLDVDEATAKMLDQVLDRACIKRSAK